MRRLIAFPCAGETLAATLDEGAGTTGLLIVSGGNEIRIGAHRGMALLAQRVASELDVPVFRFDRRGIGDSTGENHGFDTSSEDIIAAIAAFRAGAPQLKRIVALGNCDAATALALFHGSLGVDALLLANPWLVETNDDLPPAAAIRARYAERLRDPRAWLRLLRGGVDLHKLFRGLSKVSQSASEPENRLATAMANALSNPSTPATLLLASGDNTAIAFLDAWRRPAFDLARKRVQIAQFASASHSFARAEDKEWLFARVRDAVTG